MQDGWEDEWEKTNNWSKEGMGSVGQFGLDVVM